MGVFKPFRSGCAYSEHPVRSVTSCTVVPSRSKKGTSVATGNPNPQNFVFGRIQVVGAHIVAELIYPDCTNYEGRKVLVYRGVNLRTLMAQQSLDPHFCSAKDHVHPFARFEPTEAGWAAAVRCAEVLQ